MRALGLLAVVLLAVGSVLYLLTGGDRGVTDRPSGEPPARPAAPTPTSPPVAPAPSAAAPARPAEATTPYAEWLTLLLELPREDGRLTGRELEEAVERGGRMRLVGATAADLDALRAVTLEIPGVTGPQPYAALVGWLKEAGFLVEADYPQLVVRRRTDDGAAER
jgi:hypothetical protein